jgi:hypothetical protein
MSWFRKASREDGDFGPSEPDALGMAAVILHGRHAPSASPDAAPDHRVLAPRSFGRSLGPDRFRLS